MKKNFKKNLVIGLVVSLGVVTFGLARPVSVLAATSPDLKTAAGYGVLSSTFTRNVGLTTVTGNVGYTTLSGSGTLTVNGSTITPKASQAGLDQGTALAALNSQSCTFNFTSGALHLDSDITHGPIGVYTPGVYCSTGAMDIAGGSTITLNGAGTYIFRSAGAFNTTDNSKVVLNGASACDVFWTPVATTLGANTEFVGTVIDNAGITVGNTTSWVGRALNYATTVTTDTDTITVPTCAAVSSGRSTNPATINVVKVVINDSGRTKTVADFHLFVNDTPVVSGETNIFSAPASTYYVTETPDSNYTRTFSGDCDASGGIGLSPGDNKFCIITNNDIGAPAITPPVAPIIDVVKVPSPLALPDGPGLVNYTYTVRNIGTVPMTGITMVGDTCRPITLASGDINSNAKLDLTETWVYRCSTTLLETHTNTVVATGWANGLSAVDIASATVIVGVPVVPPLIHVTKVPRPLSLLNGGGLVTYTEKITNPGTVALSSVKLVDDKCSPMKYISGDLNKDSKLDKTETWTYTCQTKLTKTTTNTAVASGVANGLTVRDFAIATVVVAAPVPKLPNTGIDSQAGNAPWNIIIPVGILSLASAFLLSVLKKRKA